eukprot:CAMPEP_0184499506 /NCGR_PEP_ID=MMETSP0113_2-20130426/41645_1 /TAXON_ID=91329 /ORGANISM="Norrisiella sphaerica, Strain BC52" /LENGTH=99 /DNA_ID=CAMNT_0026887427 /DNA_START=158 /DNA_END=453 /DNA_ORIENTATION=+
MERFQTSLIVHWEQKIIEAFTACNDLRKGIVMFFEKSGTPTLKCLEEMVGDFGERMTRISQRSLKAQAFNRFWDGVSLHSFSVQCEASPCCPDTPMKAT